MKIIGHKGACGYLPENTLISINKAVELDVDIVEIDVQSTKDGEIVLYHDRYLSRLTNLEGKISDYTMLELEKSAKIAGSEPIPSLDEICSFMKEKKPKLFVEMKTPEIEKKVLETIFKFSNTDKYLIGSFYHRSLLKIKEICPKMTTIALVLGAVVDVSSLAESCNCDVLGIGIEAFDENIIKQAKKSHLKSFVWTIRDLRDIDKLISCNVDGIVTDFPDLVRKEIALKNR